MEGRTMGTQVAKPRTCTDECRRQVVDMVTGAGRTAMSGASELGIRHALTSRWVRRRGQTGGTAPGTARPTPAAPLLKPVPVPHAGQAAEVARLRRGNGRLRMERDILGKGTAICADPSRRGSGSLRIAAAAGPWR